MRSKGGFCWFPLAICNRPVYCIAQSSLVWYSRRRQANRVRIVVAAGFHGGKQGFFDAGEEEGPRLKSRGRDRTEPVRNLSPQHGPPVRPGGQGRIDLGRALERERERVLQHGRGDD